MCPFDEDPADNRSELDMCIDKIKQLEPKIKSQAKHIELLNQCDDSSTGVIAKMDKEIEQLQVENKRMKKALQAWIDVNFGAPNKYQWAKEALEGGD